MHMSVASARQILMETIGSSSLLKVRLVLYVDLSIMQILIVHRPPNYEPQDFDPKDPPSSKA